jgi:hypothetical protein
VPFDEADESPLVGLLRSTAILGPDSAKDATPPRGACLVAVGTLVKELGVGSRGRSHRR